MKAAELAKNFFIQAVMEAAGQKSKQSFYPGIAFDNPYDAIVPVTADHFSKIFTDIVYRTFYIDDGVTAEDIALEYNKIVAEWISNGKPEYVGR